MGNIWDTACFGRDAWRKFLGHYRKGPAGPKTSQKWSRASQNGKLGRFFAPKCPIWDAVSWP